MARSESCRATTTHEAVVVEDRGGPLSNPLAIIEVLCKNDDKLPVLNGRAVMAYEVSSALEAVAVAAEVGDWHRGHGEGPLKKIQA